MTKAAGPGTEGTRVAGGKGAAAVARVTARALASPSAATLAIAILEEVSAAGLLSDTTEHVSFRAPKALIEAARRNTGLGSMTDLGLLALAALARPDPVAEAMKRTRGKLGRQHRLEY